MTDGPDPGTAREEAERLVATAIGAAAMAARRIGRQPSGFGPLGDALLDTARSALGVGHRPADYRVANGSPQCCVCPVCRAIAAMRDPSPRTAERLATGAGDLAAGVAGFLRSVDSMFHTEAPAEAPVEDPAEDPVEDPWRTATREGGAR